MITRAIIFFRIAATSLLLCPIRETIWGNAVRNCRQYGSIGISFTWYVASSFLDLSIIVVILLSCICTSGCLLSASSVYQPITF